MGSITGPFKGSQHQCSGHQGLRLKGSGIQAFWGFSVYQSTIPCRPRINILSYTPKLPKTLFFQASILEFPAPS